MNAEIKVRWVEALRSGLYQKIQGALRENGGYCVMGVLCDVVKQQVGADWSRDIAGWKFGKYGYATLPLVVELLCEIDGEAMGDVIFRNDDTDESFSEIADYIEANL